MKLSEFKKELGSIQSLTFLQPNGVKVPTHFHITEVGLTSKHFIDCGSSIHTEKWANFQIWVASDTDHRLEPNKLLGIIEKSEKVLGGEDLEIEIEYQTETVGKYGLTKDNDNFVLVAKQTDCLAKELCGVPEVENSFIDLTTSKQSCCTPGGGCC